MFSVSAAWPAGFANDFLTIALTREHRGHVTGLTAWSARVSGVTLVRRRALAAERAQSAQ